MTAARRSKGLSIRRERRNRIGVPPFAPRWSSRRGFEAAALMLVLVMLAAFSAFSFMGIDAPLFQPPAELAG